ncbi:hypothetical protein ACP70R_048077 [Stipagrostis hirtigluma subsp. patula]
MEATADATTPASCGVRRRVLLFPLPFQGHLNPMLQLAAALHSRASLGVTVFHAAFNAPDPAAHPAGYRFVPVGDGVPSSDLLPTGKDPDIAGVLLRINERLQAPFKERLREALAKEGEPPACLLVDSNLRGMQMVAEELGVPTLVLRTGAAACLVAYMAFPELCDKGLLPPPSQDQAVLEMPLNELPPLRLGDVVFSTTSAYPTLLRCLRCLVESGRHSSGVIVNTIQDFENSELRKIARCLGVPIYAVGPLHKVSSGTESSLLAQDRTCLEWLDKQDVGSVLYVSFGSVASMDGNELLEAAWGLANSLSPFLWVIRPNSGQSSRQLSLPDGFEEETRGRGMVVTWAPQQDVLGHRAIGGFWTHNGWNSTLESICEGVPMICRPQFADQMINARYVQDVWKIGFKLEGKLERRKVQKAVSLLLCDEEGREMRQRANVLKDKAVRCIEKGGTSNVALDLLLERIMSF